MTADEHITYMEQKVEEDDSVDIRERDIDDHPSTGTIRVDADIKRTNGAFLKSLRRDGYVVGEVHDDHFYMNKIKSREKQVTETVTEFVKDSSK